MSYGRSSSQASRYNGETEVRYNSLAGSIGSAIFGWGLGSVFTTKHNVSIEHKIPDEYSLKGIPESLQLSIGVQNDVKEPVVQLISSITLLVLVMTLVTLLMTTYFIFGIILGVTVSSAGFLAILIITFLSGWWLSKINLTYKQC